MDFADSPFSHFVQDLRNYMLHNELPITSASLVVIPDERIDSIIKLNVKKLRHGKKWSKEAKEYINSIGDEIRLDEIIDKYRSLVVNFYKWFGQRQSELHKNDFEEISRLRKRIDQLLNKGKKV